MEYIGVVGESAGSSALGVDVPPQSPEFSSDSFEENIFQLGLLQDRAQGEVSIEDAIRRLVVVSSLFLGRLHERLKVVR